MKSLIACFVSFHQMPKGNSVDDFISVSLSHHGDFASYVHEYYQSGYLTYQDTGEVGRVCADHINSTIGKALY